MTHFHVILGFLIFIGYRHIGLHILDVLFQNLLSAIFSHIVDYILHLAEQIALAIYTPDIHHANTMLSLHH